MILYTRNILLVEQFLNHIKMIIFSSNIVKYCYQALWALREINKTIHFYGFNVYINSQPAPTPGVT